MNSSVTLHCKVYDEKPIFYNQTNYYTVARFINLDNQEVITATGLAIPRIKNTCCFLTGMWTDNSKYGPQFTVSEFQEDEEETIETCYAFLSSGLLKGLGPKTAQKIVDKFGADSLKVLENSPNKLLTISGISKKKLDEIVNCFRETRTLKKITSLVAKYNITLGKCLKIYDKFKNLSENIIKEDTYRLCEIDGIGFLTADKIARDQDPSVLTSDKRYEAVTAYILKENESTGSLYMEMSEFKTQVSTLFNNGLITPFSADDIYNKIVEVFGKSLYISEDKSFIGLKAIYDREVETAHTIKGLIKADSLTKFVADSDEEIKRLNWVSNSSLSLSDEQIDAVKMVMENNFSIITGGAGTGKTTVLRAILTAFNDCTISLLAPTGRASRRMAETTGHTASTIHSKLKLLTSEVSEEYSTRNLMLISEDIVIVDEVSMLDSYIANALFTHIIMGNKVVLIGDVNQLPSVGAGNVLQELINSGVIPVTRLNFNFRQAQNSLIAINANKILEGKSDFEYEKKEFFVVNSLTDDVAKDTIVGLYTRAIKKFNVENVALISPFRKNFLCGANSLNKIIQDEINPSVGGVEFKCNGEVFRLKDRVMQLKNRPYAMNGDVGTIVSINEEVVQGIPMIKIGVAFDDYAETVIYDSKTADELCLAYAMTVHKSQGSEYDVVILAYENNSPYFLTRNLLYTAVTRAKKQIVIVGHKELLDMSVLRDFVKNRISLLGTLLS